MSGLVSAVRSGLEDKEFRDAYVAENARRGLAYQIKALRESREWSGAEFARRAGRPQSNVSRWEDPSYGKFNLSTLIEIASVFDVALSVRFVSFGELLAKASNVRKDMLAIPDYETEQRQAIEQRDVGGSAMAAFSKLPEQRVNTAAAMHLGAEVRSRSHALAHLPIIDPIVSAAPRAFVTGSQ
jgi:transcriptional regulator with XRE-family HTH domain